MNCSKCNAQLVEDAAFCPHCGAPTNSTSANSAPAQNTCPHCGKTIDSNMAFCPFCGYSKFGPTPNPTPNPNPIQPLQAGFQSLEKHILLTIFTLGIWNLVWIYKMTQYLNREESFMPRDATSQTLLCLIPFYKVFWLRQSAAIVEKMAERYKLPAELSMPCTILGIIKPGFATIFMQSKINEIITMDDRKSKS